MHSFLVFLYDGKAETEVTILCKSEEELSLFLDNYDKDRYEIIGDIQHITGELQTDYKFACKYPNIEFGKE